jgi:hypothetical protein
MMLPDEALDLATYATAYGQCPLPNPAEDESTRLRHLEERTAAHLALYRYLTDLGWTSGH